VRLLRRSRSHVDAQGILVAEVHLADFCGECFYHGVESLAPSLISLAQTTVLPLDETGEHDEQHRRAAPITPPSAPSIVLLCTTSAPADKDAEQRRKRLAGPSSRTALARFRSWLQISKNVVGIGHDTEELADPT
jgi:hypothetical protein